MSGEANGSVRDTAPLIGDKPSKAKVLGQEVLLDDENWHYVMVLPLLTDKNQEDYKHHISHPEKKAKEIFKKKTMAMPVVGSKFQKQMTEQEYHETVRSIIGDLLSSSTFGLKLGTKVSIDGDELFLMLELADEDAKVQIASSLDWSLPLKESEYDKKLKDPFPIDGGTPFEEFSKIDHRCPTTNYSGGKFYGSIYCPAYAYYSSGRAGSLQPFREVDALRMIWRRLEEYVSIEHLIAQGIIVQMFPVHRYSEIQKLSHSGFFTLRGLCKPLSKSDPTIDKVRDYFGEEVAFFFDWLNFSIRMMAPMAFISLLVFARYFLNLEPETRRYIQMSFAGILCLWASIFVERYNQNCETKIEQWGMRNLSQVSTVRPEFKLSYRGSTPESIQNGFHWCLVLAFMVETVLVTFAISAFRMDVDAHPDGERRVPWVDNETASDMGKYLITINIKIMAFIWGILSPALSGWENHKTDQDLKAARVSKIFAVKAVVYYYPFFYIAFVKRYIEGCGEVEGCVPELVENLAVFFATHIASVIAMIMIQIGWAKYQIWSEVKKAKKTKGEGVAYTYLQLQAKCPPYLEDTDDLMELVLSLGFVMMFAVALPVMACLAFITNLIEVKILAWRMAHVNQRARPMGQYGIGVWSDIIRILSTAAVVCNAGLAVFSMHPIKDMDTKTKLIIFVGLQNSAMVLKFIIESFIPMRPLNLVRIQEINELAVDDIFGDDKKIVQAKSTKKPDLGMKQGTVA
eukprot:CAMPEP_0170607740 /NCGR_PEP_ID=MMETSP0224-20130122/21213_1 /TAXON_ID=285029 /ORGANISM="Togula jolla, Strain CCCM 725" /LENGTH=741 /DNA_ID=CAMNT_0010932921 /DNA_START=60 /DNA_END=2285 /DNA_ORIENTATION=-